MDQTFLANYLEKSLIGVPTIITMTILNQPEILSVMSKINNIDEITIENKLRGFLGADMLNDKSTIILVPLLCSLMYKNDIFPIFINDILTDLNITGVTVEELKNNSENLINLLLENYKGGKKGGANFGQMLRVLGQIAFVINVVMYDNWFIKNSGIPEEYEKATAVLNTVKRAFDTAVAKNVEEKCGYVEVPSILRYLDKYNSNQYQLEHIYQVVVCVSHNTFNINLQNEVFMPENIKNMTFGNVNFEERIKQKGMRQTQAQEMVSNELVSSGYNFDREIIEQEMALISTEIQPVIENIEGNITGLFIYDNETINLEKTKENLMNGVAMTQEQFISLVYPEYKNKKNPIKKNINKGKRSFFASTGEFLMDTTIVMYDMSRGFLEIFKNKPLISTVDITTQYYWIFKDYCRKQLESIEDLQRQTSRDINTFITETERMTQKIFGLIESLKYLIFKNIAAAAIIASWTYNFCLKIRRTVKKHTGQLAIESGQLAIENSSQKSPSGQLRITGGRKKTKKNKRKLRQNRKSRKNKKKNTRKIKKTRKY